MNECFVVAEIVEGIHFEFLYKQKQCTIAFTKVKLSNSSIIKVYGYDNIADFMYRNLKNEQKVFIYGNLTEKGIMIKRLSSWIQFEG